MYGKATWAAKSHNLTKVVYSTTTSSAHDILRDHVLPWGMQGKLVIYVDIPQAVEKQHLAAIREAACDIASTKCTQSLDTLETRVENRLKVCKSQFAAVRTSLMTYMLVYTFITTVWRPISKRLFLKHNLATLLQDIGLSRIQLTTLAIVSFSDYNRNVHPWAQTNYSIVKKLVEQNPRTMVRSYLSHPHVVSKNTHDETFEISIRVFVDQQQTPMSSDEMP
ncbi:hypothetical protein BGX29_006325 [Mortierella sp. GBA35]|nr:hypothetical protein BGX29_006325 [Mortierella sp. GBA35]